MFLYYCIKVAQKFIFFRIVNPLPTPGEFAFHLGHKLRKKRYTVLSLRAPP